MARASALLARDDQRHPVDSLGASSGSPADNKFDCLSRVLERTSLSRATLYREVAGGRFPKPHRLSPGRVGWLRSEIDAWIATRVGD